MATATTTRAEDEDGHHIIDVVTPSAGESVTEGTILEWHFQIGDPIKADETIVEISTDKVDVELPAPARGRVSEILVAEGETVTVGQVIARIAVDGAPDGAAAPASSQAQAPADGSGVPANASAPAAGTRASPVAA